MHDIAFLLPDFGEIKNGSARLSLDLPVFSLSKTPDRASRAISTDRPKIVVLPAASGRATIWDQDLLIDAATRLRRSLDLGAAASRRVTFSPRAFTRATGRARPSGSHDRHLVAALERLVGTVLEVRPPHGSTDVPVRVRLLSDWCVATTDPRGRATSVDVELAPWMAQAVEEGRTLALPRAYFALKGGLERRLYQLARRHCAATPNWRVALAPLYALTGSRSPERTFRFALRRLATRQPLPGFFVSVSERRGEVTFWHREAPLFGARAGGTATEDAAR